LPDLISKVATKVTVSQDGKSVCVCAPHGATKEKTHLLVNMLHPHPSKLPWDFVETHPCPGHDHRVHFVFKLHQMEGGD